MNIAIREETCMNSRKTIYHTREMYSVAKMRVPTHLDKNGSRPTKLRDLKQNYSLLCKETKTSNQGF
jgi:hypothetical protein